MPLRDSKVASAGPGVKLTWRCISSLHASLVVESKERTKRW